MFLKRSLSCLLLCLAVAACKPSEERAEAAFQRGLDLVAQGDDDRARVEFRNALGLSQTHIGASLELARLHLRDGNDRAAFRNFLRVVEQQPENVEALQQLTRIAFLLRDFETFDRYAPRAVDAAPEEAGNRVIDLAYRYRQAVTEEDGPARAALLSEAETLAEDMPDSEILRQILIDGYIHAGRFEAALAQVEAAIGANPDSATFYELKAQLTARLGDDAATKAALRQMIEAFPDNVQYKQAYLQFLVQLDEIDAAEAFLRAGIDAAEPDDRMAAYGDLIRFMQAFRSPEAVRAELDRLIAENPDLPGLRAMRAGLRFERGEREAAISEMEALLARDDAALDADERRRLKVALARMLATTGNHVGARRLVEEILQEDPTEPGALKLQAGWLIEEDKTGEAITALRTALAEAPEDIEAMTLMAAAYERAGNTDLRMEFLALAVETSNNAPEPALRYARVLLNRDRLSQAESVLIASLRINPGNPQLLSLLGQIYVRQDDRARARHVIETLRDLGGDAPEGMADALELQLVAREEGTDKALEFLGRMAEGEDGSDRAKLALIQGMIRSGRPEEALDYVEELVRDNPESVEYAYFRALTLAAGGDVAAAEAALSDLVEKEPRAVVAWLQLVRLQNATGKPDEAAATIDRALEALPGAGDLLWAKASLLERQGDIDGAIAIYEQLYEEHSNSPVIANNLASLLTTYRDDAESLERARVIARRLKESDVPALQDTYGWILHRTGDTEEALSYLEPAAQALERDPVVQVHLGLAYQALGRTEDARAQLARARQAAGEVVPESTRRKIAELETALAPE